MAHSFRTIGLWKGYVIIRNTINTTSEQLKRRPKKLFQDNKLYTHNIKRHELVNSGIQADQKNAWITTINKSIDQT